MKRYTLGGYDAYMEEWPGGSWVSYDDAEQAERERDEAREQRDRLAGLLDFFVDRCTDVSPLLEGCGCDVCNNISEARKALADIGGGK